MIEDEKVKAVREIAEFGSVTLETAQKLCGFLARIFGTVPEDVIGILGGDWLRHVRIRNFAKLSQRTEEILKERGILESVEPVSPSIALPILEGAQAESREELQELWSRLLANAMDRSRAGSVRQSIIDTVKKFDPLDALLLEKLPELPQKSDHWIPIEKLHSTLEVSRDEIQVSIRNLKMLDCMDWQITTIKQDIPGAVIVRFTFFGREILRACSLE